MAIIVQILQWLIAIGSLVCFVLVVIQMFQRGQTGLAIACIVLLFCCGIGKLVAFIYGWVKSKEWGITNLMLAWTGIIVLGFIVGGIGFATGAIEIPKMQP
ncbi:MAG TPA: hypothetical protein VKI65_18030 [Gemmataceae bacterium]|nr:hypothetical protein [Gemmataceae bacterium]